MSRREVLESFEKYKDEIAERVNFGIENYRKGAFRLKLTDKDGKPIAGARLKISQRTHEFKYGANLFMLDELESTEKNELYKKYFKEAFNMATLPFYWSDLEPEQGKTRYEKDSPKIYRRPAPDLCMEFCEQNGIEPREHALAYDHFFPEWFKKLPLDEEKRLLKKRYAEIAERYADRIPTIEVTNEHGWEITSSGETSALYEQDDFVEWCFAEAQRYFPDNQLVINEFGAFKEQGRSRDLYYMIIERALKNGARIDAVGLQYHIFARREGELEYTQRTNYNPHHLYKVMDRYAELGKPLQITEVTVPAYSSEPEDEEIQAEIIKNLYSIWFSHPNMEQIIYWNLVDGYAAFAPQGDMTAGENYYHGGLIRFDFTPKPSYYVIKDLFTKVWHTDTECVTGCDGACEFRGFFGDYELELDGEKYTFSANKTIRADEHGRRSITVKTS